MRTKSILLGAAVLAAGVAAATAQNVYSVNVVGYVNLAIPGTNTGSGLYALIANPLDASANGGNSLSNLFPNPADGTTVLIWDPAHSTYKSDSYVFGAWNSNGVLQLPPGSAAFVLSQATWTNTFVGQVMQGSLSNVFGNLAVNSFVGSQVPIAGTADSLNLTTGLPDGSTVEPWDVVHQSFTGYSWTFGSWSDPHGNPNPPPIAVGQGLLINTPPGQHGLWATNFTVQ